MAEENSMKRSRFTESQILAVLRQAEVGCLMPDLCREHGISTATFYKWRSKYGGMDASMVSQRRRTPEPLRVCRGLICLNYAADRNRVAMDLQA
jgi:putative transposase